jgi:hypothetical protein
MLPQRHPMDTLRPADAKLSLGVPQTVKLL